MELKHNFISLCRCWGELLIVPYGIETEERIVSWFADYRLLIVPYGIETFPFTRKHTVCIGF